ncbi:ATP-binding protein [Allohahella marinimesophila]|uniref:histidine kinase n=1 Tax=Allohahella marinimesophila TaxID=1054972 RepID=A0ABP7P173_9GAMM
MTPTNTPADEIHRLAILDSYGILDTPVEKSFDDVVRLLSQLLNVPIAAVNLIAEGRQWFKSELGLGTREMPLDDSICKFAILQPGQMIIPDTKSDVRFECNPLVVGDPGLRFYAGARLETSEGVALGTLCALDVKPRPAGLTEQEQFILDTLAQQIMSQIELRKAVMEQQLLFGRQMEIQQELQVERDQSRRLLEGMDEGFVLLDNEFRIRQINAGALRFEAFTAEDILGKTHWEAWPGSEALPLAEHYRRAMKDRLAESFEQHHAFADGRSCWLDVRAYPAIDGLAIFYRDITQRKEAESRWRQTADRLEFTLKAAEIGDWDLDLVNDTSYRSSRHDQCFGYSTPIEHWSMKSFIEHVHPDDRNEVLSRFQSSLATQTDWQFECRVIWPDDSLHWIAVHGSVYGSNIKPERMSGIVIDVTEQKRTEEDLRQADQKKDEFLAMLAHELRNPLAPITSAAAVLSGANIDTLTVRRTSAIIARQAKHMTSLIDDLLDVSRVTRGNVEIEKTETDLKDVITDALEQVRPLIEKHRHQLSVQLAPATATVIGDRKRLVQITTNLLNNAAKYTPDGGEIRLVLATTAETVELSVIDNGIGMSAELICSAFELFSQGHRGLDRSQGGLGIGLALVRSLLALHGGSIVGSSDGPGQGSTFKVELPRACQTGTSDRQMAHHDMRQSQSLRIAIVDDNEDAATTLALLLETLGHQVLTTYTAREALDSLDAFLPDVCLLDIGLPDMDGYSLARSLRVAPATTSAVLIAVTGYAQQKDRQEAFAAGFDDLFAKPVDLPALNLYLAQIANHRLRTL